MKKLFLVLTVISFAIVLMAVSREEAGLQQVPRAAGATAGSSALKVDADFGEMPLYFIANQGQMDERVAYYSQGKDKTIYFTPEGLTIVLSDFKTGSSERGSGRDPSLRRKTAPFDEVARVRGNLGRPVGMGGNSPLESWVVKLDFVGANRNVKPMAEEKTEAVISYFKGKPDDWKTGLPTYTRIVYHNLWPGIDLVYSGTVNKLKYEFIVHPGADPSRVRLAYRGATAVSVTERGQLEVTTPAGRFQDDVPVAYQDVAGKRVPVSLAFRLEQKEEDFSYGFEVGGYDHSLPLVLDPAFLVYCGFIGGASFEEARGVAVDNSGNAYITGDTFSNESSFPVVVGPNLAYTALRDTFVAKVNASGTALVYCGYIGGTGQDHSESIAVDRAGNAYIMGYTDSNESSFPVIVGPDLTQNGDKDSFVAKVNSSGAALVYCGFIGGAYQEFGWGGIAVDGEGNSYITGYTASYQSSFPVKVGPDLSHNGGYWDTFVAKVDASGTALVYCGYIGGSDIEFDEDIAVDSSGAAYIVGYTYSDENSFPVTVGPYPTYKGECDAFVAKVNPAGSALSYCGYIGGSSWDRGRSIAVDGLGNAYIAGTTVSDQTSFPVVRGPDLTYNGDNEIFVAKVNAEGTGFVYCGYIGCWLGEGASGIAVDYAGCAYVTGDCQYVESCFPVIAGPKPVVTGEQEILLAKVNAAGTELVYCGYMGGERQDFPFDLAVDNSGNPYIVGMLPAGQESFPVAIGPDLTENGDYEAFVAKVTYDPDFTAAGKNLSNSAAMSSRYPKVASDPATDSVFAVWVETSGSYDALYFSKSANGGVTWSAPLALSGMNGQILANVSDLEDDYAIAMAVDSPYIHVVMQRRSNSGDDFEIFYRRSTDLGGSWGSWIQLTTNTTPSMHPDVAARSGYVHICYEDSWPGNNEIMYKRIASNGGGAVDLTRRLTTGAAESGFSRIAVSKDGEHVCVVYQDNSNLFYKHIWNSSAGAFTTRTLTSGTSFNGLPDIAVSTGADDQYVYIVYQALWPGNMDIMYMRLGSYGLGGGSPYMARLTYSTTESSSAAVFFDPGTNNLHITYHDLWPGNYDVMYRQLANYGGGGFTGKRISWGTGDSSHAAVGGSSGLVYVVWSDNSSGNYEVYLKKSN